MAIERKGSPSVARPPDKPGRADGDTESKDQPRPNRTTGPPSILHPVPECGGAIGFVAHIPRGGEWSRSETSPSWCDTT